MNYIATLSVMGRKYTAEGETAIDAILNLKPSNPKGKGILSVSNGVSVREKIMQPHMTSRLFNSVGLNREVAMKNMRTMFDGF